MKKVIMTILILTSMTATAQVQYTNEPTTGSSIGVIMDVHTIKKLPYDNQTLAVHVGMWTKYFGVFGGYVCRGLSNSKPVTEPGIKEYFILTVAPVARLFSKTLYISPFISYGTSSYKEIGIRAGINVPNYGVFCLKTSTYTPLGLSVIIDIRRDR